METVCFAGKRSGEFPGLKGDVSERESKITKDIKFAKSVIAALKEGRPAPPALPFQNHLVFIDELEMEMNDDDFFQLLSTETQTILVDRYNEHQEILASLQAQEQQAIIDEGTMDIIRQTVQSSVAKATALQFDALQEQGMVREEAVDPLAQAEQLGVVPPQQQQ